MTFRESSIPAERRESILRLIQEKRVCTIQELAERFSVSRATIHRILDGLAPEGLVEKVRGGVRVPDWSSGIETRFGIRQRTCGDKKAEIARKALACIASGDTIYVDSSTTCLALARLLPTLQSVSLTVITSSPVVSYELSSAPNIGVMSTGGELSRDLMAFVGDLTLEAIHRLSFSKAFISVGGISIDRGLMSSQSSLADVKRTVIECAQDVTVLADDSKLERVAPKLIAPLDRVNRLVTNSGADEDLLDRYRSAGVEVW